MKYYRFGVYVIPLAAVMLALLSWPGTPARVASAREAEEGDQPSQQKWLELDVDDGLKKNEFAVRKILQTGTFANAGEEAMFAGFFTDYYLPRWSQAKNRNQLPEFRKNVRDLLRINAPSPKVHQRLTEILLEFLEKQLAANKKIDPAVRVNAMLMIGEVMAKGGTPLPEAVPVLLSAVVNSQQIEAVKAAALIGLIEHAKKGMDEQDAQKVTKAMIALVKTPSQGKGDGHCWLRGQAAEVLGLLGSPGQKGEVAGALYTMMVDKTLRFRQRCIAAQALGKLDYTDVTFKAGVLLVAMAQLAVDVLNAEVQTEKPESRRVRCLLRCISEGVNGVKAVADKAATDVATVIDDLLQELDSKSSPTDEKLRKLLEETRGELAAVIKKGVK